MAKNCGRISGNQLHSCYTFGTPLPVIALISTGIHVIIEVFLSFCAYIHVIQNISENQ